jgi:hypothetical protein
VGASLSPEEVILREKETREERDIGEAGDGDGGGEG